MEQEQTWESWVRLLARSTNHNDVDLLIAKIKVLLAAAHQQGREEVIREVANWLDAQPQDFCNDGEYSNEKMIDCLSGVIKAQSAKIRAFLQSL